jgi:hypothetical protein
MSRELLSNGELMAEYDLDQACAVLERTPGALRAMLSGLPDVWIHSNEGPDTWTPYEVVGHLIQGERTDWISRMLIILDGTGERRFTPFDRTAMLALGTSRPLAELLDEFERERAKNLATLRQRNLQPADLDRMGLHPALGPVTLRQLLATWVAHDLTHIAQIARTMARQYSTAVGPWAQYIGVISRN